MRMVKQLTRLRYLFDMLQTMMPKYDKKRADVLNSNKPFLIVLVSSADDLRYAKKKGATATTIRVREQITNFLTWMFRSNNNFLNCRS
jgi:hypothetical protein